MQSTPSGSFTRREIIKGLGAGAALIGLGLAAPRAVADGRGASSGATLGWELPPLGYAYGALEPHFDARTMEIHHGKHHQAYLTASLKLLEGQPDWRARGPEAILRELASVPEALRAGLRNQVGGHANHALFWRILTPGGAAEPSGALAARLIETFGSVADFKKQFAAAALSRFGSGWAWLSVKPDGTLLVHSTANQDSPLSEGLTPLLGLDVWEHAYYLHYQNRRADYVGAFWSVLNWAEVGRNFASAGKV